MTEKIKIRENWIQNAKVNKNDYALLYDKSINKNEEFWKEQGKRIKWIKPFSKIKNVKYSSKNVVIQWYYDGSLNVSYNCIDRHALNNPEKIAIIWEGDDPKVSKKITYKELLENVCKTANVLKKIGVKKGDRVITSGLGGLFPKGILIGNIVEVKRQPHELFQTAGIETAVDLSRMEEVFIIISGPYPQGSPLFTEK